MPKHEPKIHSTNWWELLILIVGLAAAAFILVRFNYNSMPPVPTIAGLSLAVVAAVDAVLAWVIRGRIASRRIGVGQGRIHPIVVARAVALAKASAVLGAIATGIWLGLLVYVWPRKDTLTEASGDLPGTIIGLVCAIALMGAAAWLEHCCRNPGDHDDPDNPSGQPTPPEPA